MFEVSTSKDIVLHDFKIIMLYIQMQQLNKQMKLP